MVTPELARGLTELSNQIQRQLGVLIDRRGHVRAVVVGDARAVFLPDLSSYRRGRDRLCGLRLVHTHLHGEPLNDDDLTDLTLLRLDLVAALEVLEDGQPGKLFMAHLLPNNAAHLPWSLLDPVSVHDLNNDFLAMIESLEEEFARHRVPRPAGDLRDRAILIHVSSLPRTTAEDSLAELGDLARSAGIKVVGSLIQHHSPERRFVLGRGKLKEAIIKAMQLGAEALVFDLNLTPAQVEALATFTDLKVLDRSQVILDIFAQHAQTREGKIQVELAQLRYLLPRLGAKQAASAFSRLTGGIGGRGPGETKLEIDRRRAEDRIARLEREVRQLSNRRKLRRQMRTEKGIPIISIVGYTNAGKSTLLNRLTAGGVVVEDALFSTLNPVSRRLRFPRMREVIVTDTVGFIRNLPQELIAAFRATLEELDEADLLLHVLDAASRAVDDQFKTVQALLAELRLNHKPVVLALNKSDLCDPATLRGLAIRYGAVPICALDQNTFGPLLSAIETALWPHDVSVTCYEEMAARK